MIGAQPKLDRHTVPKNKKTIRSQNSNKQEKIYRDSSFFCFIYFLMVYLFNMIPPVFTCMFACF